METNSTYYTGLIIRYFSGEASPGDILELEAWVTADATHRDLFREYQKTWQLLDSTQTIASAELDHEWAVLKSKIVNRKSKIVAWSLRAAAVFVLLAIPAFLLFHFLASPIENQLAAGNEVKEYTLPDGTVVTLNAGAVLSCPSKFSGNSRNVMLEGTAWFEVAHDKAKPFIIASGNARIQVVGTSFFVNTHTLSNTKEIILASGKVKVYYENNPSKMSFLSPGDKAELTADGNAIITTSNEDANYLAWKTKHMVFCNTSLNEVVALLIQVYHTNILISDNRLSDSRITATFDKQSLESVLNVLKATLDLQIRNTGAGIELSGRGSN